MRNDLESLPFGGVPLHSTLKIEIMKKLHKFSIVLKIEGSVGSLNKIKAAFETNCCFESTIGKDPSDAQEDLREHNLHYYGTPKDITHSDVTVLYNPGDAFLQLAFDTEEHPPINFVQNMCQIYAVSTYMRYLDCNDWYSHEVKFARNGRVLFHRTYTVSLSLSKINISCENQ